MASKILVVHGAPDLAKGMMAMDITSSLAHIRLAGMCEIVHIQMY